MQSLEPFIGASRPDYSLLPQLYRDAATRQWNARVTKHMTLVGETETHMLFVHATKGKRRISKRRLFLKGLN